MVMLLSPTPMETKASASLLCWGHPLLEGRYQACSTPMGEEPAGWGDQNSSGLGEENRMGSPEEWAL